MFAQISYCRHVLTVNLNCLKEEAEKNPQNMFSNLPQIRKGCEYCILLHNDQFFFYNWK